MKALSSILIVVALAQTSPLKQDSLLQPDKHTSCTAFEPCSLVGKPSVSVVVEGLRDEAKAAGLNEIQIKTDTELELRRHGISAVEFEKSDVALYVNLNAMAFDAAHDHPHFAYNVGMYCMQKVRLCRKPGVVIYGAITWETKSVLGLCPRSTLKMKTAEIVRDQTRQFANAYLAANQ